MNSADLDGSAVLAAVFGADATLSHVRGLARCVEGEVVIEAEDGNTYRVDLSWAERSFPVDEQVRDEAPAHLRALLVGARYVVAVPPRDADFAIARTPGWKARLTRDP
jgi:hypothetical protein